MKLYVVALAGILTSSQISYAAAQPPTLTQKEEQLLIDQINRNPKSEEKRHAYAWFLYGEKRFQEADEQLDQLFLLNPTHEMGVRLRASIEQIKKMTDQKQIDEAMTNFVLSYAEHSFQGLEGTLQSLKSGEIPTDPSSKMLREQAKNQENSYQPTWEEFQSIILLGKFIDQADSETVLKEFGEARRKFPDSPSLEVRYLTYLIDQGMIEEAEKSLSSSRGKYPDSLEINTIENCVAKLKTAKSTEQIAYAKQEMHSALVDIGMGQFDRLTEKSEGQKAPDS